MALPPLRFARGAGAAVALDFGQEVGACLITENPTFQNRTDDGEDVLGFSPEWWNVINGSVDMNTLAVPPAAAQEAKLAYEMSGFRQRYRSMPVPNRLLRRYLKEAHTPGPGPTAALAMALFANPAADDREYLLCYPGGPEFKQLLGRRVSPGMPHDPDPDDAQNQAIMDQYTCDTFSESIAQIVCSSAPAEEETWLAGVRTRHDFRMYVLEDKGETGDCSLRCVDAAQFAGDTACMVISPYACEAALASRDGAVCLWSPHGVAAVRTLAAGARTQKRWWSLAYGPHPRSLLVANSKHIVLDDFRAPPRRSLLLDTAPNLPDMEFTAMARPTDDSFLYASASPSYINLMDTRMPGQPVLRWRHRQWEDPVAELLFVRDGVEHTLLAMHPQNMDVVAYTFTPTSPVYGRPLAVPTFIQDVFPHSVTPGPAMPLSQPRQVVGFADLEVLKKPVPANVRLHLTGIAALPLPGAGLNSFAIACGTTNGAVFVGHVAERDTPRPDPPPPSAEDEAAAKEQEDKERARRRARRAKRLQVFDVTDRYEELTNELELAEVTAEPSGLTLEGALDMLREGPVRKADLTAAGVDVQELLQHEGVVDGGEVLLHTEWSLLRKSATPTTTATNPYAAHLRNRWMPSDPKTNAQGEGATAVLALAGAAVAGAQRSRGATGASSAKKSGAAKKTPQPQTTIKKKVGFL